MKRFEAATMKAPVFFWNMSLPPVQSQKPNTEQAIKNAQDVPKADATNSVSFSNLSFMFRETFNEGKGSSVEG